MAHMELSITCESLNLDYASGAFAFAESIKKKAQCENKKKISPLIHHQLSRGDEEGKICVNDDLRAL